MIRESLPDLANPELVNSVAEKAARAATLLRNIARDYAPVVFANSLGAEDMVLTDLIWREEINIAIFSLDTGRLPVETYELIHQTEKHYGRKLDIFFPRHNAVEAYARAHGSHGFYDSVEARKACCHARKVEPLQRALAGKGAWVTGLRAAQSTTPRQAESDRPRPIEQSRQSQPAVGLERGGSLGVPARQQRTLQPTA